MTKKHIVMHTHLKLSLNQLTLAIKLVAVKIIKLPLHYEPVFC